MRRSFSFWVPFLFLQALIAMNFGCADGRGVESFPLNNGDELVFNFEDTPTLSIKGDSDSWDKAFTEDKISMQINNYGAPNQSVCISVNPDWSNNQTEVTPGMFATTVDSDGQSFNATELEMVNQLNSYTALKANIDNTSYDLKKMLLQGNLQTVVLKRNGKDPKTFARSSLENEVKVVNGKGYKNIICTEANVPLKLTLAKRLSVAFNPISIGNGTLLNPNDGNSNPAPEENGTANNNSGQKQDVLGSGASATNSGSADTGSAAAGGCSLQKAINL